jgi:hypothetical protein
MKGFFICLSSQSEQEKTKTANDKALKGRVAVPGCIQRAGECWKARMPTNRE